MLAQHLGVDVDRISEPIIAGEGERSLFPASLNHDFLTQKEINAVSALAATKLPWRTGTMLVGMRGVVDTKKRQSQVVEAPQDNPTIKTILQRINAQLQHPDLALQTIQLMRYETSDHFAPHTDYHPTANPRTCTTTILTQPATGGGIFHLKQIPINLQPGSLLIFDSRTTHHITKITTGSRLALVAWYWKKPALPNIKP